MRFIAIAFILASYPLLVSWIKNNPRKRHWAYFGLGLLPFTASAWNLDAGLISWATWPGYSKGLVVTLLDSLALAVITTHRSPRGMPPLSGFIVLYILAALLSVAMSDVPMGSAFYAWQLLRMLIMVVAVAKVASDTRSLKWIAMGLAAGITYQAGFTIWQRASGVFQASGTMGHQNLLGLMTHFVTLPLLAMLLGGMRSRVIMLGVVSALVVITLGASRGAIGFGLMGIFVLIVLSIIRRSTPRKWQIVGMAALSLAVISPFILQSLQTRLGQLASAPGAADERVQFEEAAKAIIHDYPMGIGANQYVVVANTKGYSERAGVAWNWTSRSANVHNTYLLVTAETGWVGLATFLALFASAIFTGLRFAFQNRRDPRGDIVLGCAVAILATAAHNFYEWIWVTDVSQYVFGLSLGVISGMVRARARENRLKRIERARARAVLVPELGISSGGQKAVGYEPAVNTELQQRELRSSS